MHPYMRTTSFLAILGMILLFLTSLQLQLCQLVHPYKYSIRLASSQPRWRQEFRSKGNQKENRCQLYLVCSFLIWLVRSRTNKHHKYYNSFRCGACSAVVHLHPSGGGSELSVCQWHARIDENLDSLLDYRTSAAAALSLSLSTIPADFG